MIDKQMIGKSKEWLSSMNEILSRKTEKEDIEHIKDRIETQKWLIWRAETLQEIIDTWIDVEENGKVDDAEDFYSIVQNILGGGSDE